MPRRQGAGAGLLVARVMISANVFSKKRSGVSPSVSRASNPACSYRFRDRRRDRPRRSCRSDLRSPRRSFPVSTTPALSSDDEVGAAVALAGDDREAARLDRQVGDERVADHDGGGAVGQLQDPGLVEEDDDRFGRQRGRSRRRDKATRHQDPIANAAGPIWPGLARTTPPSRLSETLRGTTTTEEAVLRDSPIDAKLVKEMQICRRR
jgi:hypothetical protein